MQQFPIEFRLALSLLIVFLPSIFYIEMNTHHGFYAGSIGAKEWAINQNFKSMPPETTRINLKKLNVWTSPNEAKWTKGQMTR